MLAFDLDPGAPADVLDCAQVGPGCASCSSGSGSVLPEDLGLQGPPGLRSAERHLTYEQTEPFAHAVAQALERNSPDLVVSQMAEKLSGRGRC